MCKVCNFIIARRNILHIWEVVGNGGLSSFFIFLSVRLVHMFFFYHPYASVVRQRPCRRVWNNLPKRLFGQINSAVLLISLVHLSCSMPLSRSDPFRFICRHFASLYDHRISAWTRLHVLCTASWLVWLIHSFLFFSLYGVLSIIFYFG